MKIIILNGSHRKNGATALILNEMYQKLETYPHVEVHFFNVANLNLKYCIGCYKCYRNGKCIFNDDIEKLSENIETADGIIIGSPTYASNVSGQIKVIIDRGHFVIEQLLLRKYAISVSTYKNYGGKETSKILNRLLSCCCLSSFNITEYISYVKKLIVCKIPFVYNGIINHKRGFLCV